MDLRRPLTILVGGLFVLVVAFAVLAAASSFSISLGDRFGAIVLWRVALTCLLLLVIDGFLLLALLGWSALDDSRFETKESGNQTGGDQSDQTDFMRMNDGEEGS